MYIHDAASISPLGLQDGLAIETNLQIPTNFSAIEPAYTEVLPANLARRMAKITRMALYCGLQIANRNSEKAIDGIIAATGLGNLADTEKFIQTYLRSQGGLIPPTSFTQSSHNTIAGQLALILKNHNYNVTYVQQSFSFESALRDAQLQLAGSMQHVLVGAADENIPLLATIANNLQVDDALIQQLSEGAAFFLLSSEASAVAILDVAIAYEASDIKATVNAFLAKHDLEASQVFTIKVSALTHTDFTADVDANRLFGRHFTNSAQAIHLAAAHLAKGLVKNVLVVTLDHQQNIALTLLGAE